MSDQGLWFKLWCSCLDDPALSNLDIADFGRWAKLGALLRQHGQAGEIVFQSPGKVICEMFQVPDFDALEACFIRMFHARTNVVIHREMAPVSGETILIVSFKNWQRFQEDWSTPRVRRHRDKVKRLRREEKRIPPISPTGDSGSEGLSRDRENGSEFGPQRDDRKLAELAEALAKAKGYRK